MKGALSLDAGTFFGGKNIPIFGGDAEFAMHMVALTTGVRYRKKRGTGRLIFLLLDDQSNKSTCGQCAYHEHIDCPANEAASGISVAGDFNNTSQFVRQLYYRNIGQGEVIFTVVRCAFDPDMPRPPMDAIIDSKFNFNEGRL